MSLDSINHMITIRATRHTVDSDTPGASQGVVITPQYAADLEYTTAASARGTSCRRQIIMPLDAAIEMTQGKYTMGVLHLTVPKLTPTGTANKLAISVCPEDGPSTKF